MSTRLKPCPFCNSSNIDVEDNVTCDGFAEYYCRCKNCWAKSGGVLRMGGRDNISLAIEQWNTRAREQKEILDKIYTEDDLE